MTTGSTAPAAPASAAPAFVRHGTLPVTLLVQAAVSAAVLVPTVAAPRLPVAQQLGPVAVGLYIAAVYLAAMVSSQWGAVLVRRWGPIRSSQFALLACGLGLMLVAVPNAAVALAGALLLGVGYGPVTPASSEMLARTTPPERYALVFSVKQTGVPLGGAVAGLGVPALLGAGSIGAAFAAMAALCAAGLLLAQPLRAALDAQRDPAAPGTRLATVAAPVRRVFGDPALRRVALCTLVFSTVQVSLTSYLVSYLTADLGWTLVAAGAAASLAQGAAIVGRIGWGWLADRGGGADAGGRALRVLAGLALLMMACSIALSQAGRGTAPWLLSALLVAYGASAIGWNGVFLATVARLVPPGEAATATAGSLFFTYLGVVLGPPLFGAIGHAAGGLGPAFAALALPLVGALVLLLRRPRSGLAR